MIAISPLKKLFQQKRHTNSSGFSLLEIVIALAIMSLSIVAILDASDRSIRAVMQGKESQIIRMLAKNKMLEIEDELQFRKFLEVEPLLQGVFKAPFEEYQWKREVKEVTLPNLLSLAKQDQQTNQSDMVNSMVTNFLSKSLREVSVSILWKRLGQDQSFTVTTYWVNLNNDFSLSPI